MQNLVTHTSLRTSLKEGTSPPTDDLLGRAGFVEALRNYLATHDAGTIVSVEGPWGSGKTHVLHSLAWKVGRPVPVSAESDAPPSTPAPGALVYWLNPWLQRDVDLIGTLVLMIVEDIVASEKVDPQASAVPSGDMGGDIPTAGDASVLAPKDRNWRRMVEALLPELIQLALFGVAAVGTAVGGKAEAACAAPAVSAAGELWSFLRTSAPAIAQLVTKLRAGRVTTGEATVGNAGDGTMVASGAAPVAPAKVTTGKLSSILQTRAPAVARIVTKLRAARVSTADVPTDADESDATFAQRLAGSCGAVDSLQNALTALGQLVSVARYPRSSRALPLYVFIDDLDRCLPQTQVAVLQQLYWLSNSGASLVFVVGVDASMLESALRIHYRSVEVDAHRYLQKLFTLRAPLPENADDTARHLFAQLTQAPDGSWYSGSGAAEFTDALDACRVFPTPREYERLTDAMRLWAAHGVSMATQLADKRWQAYWGLVVVNPGAVSQFLALDARDRYRLVVFSKRDHAAHGVGRSDSDPHARTTFYQTVFDSGSGMLLHRLIRVGCDLSAGRNDASISDGVTPAHEKQIDRFCTFLRAVQRFEIPPA